MRRNRSNRSPLPVIAALCLGTLPASTVAAQDLPIEINAHALDSQPQSRIEGDSAMDDAVAAALIGAIAGQFDAPGGVHVKIDEVAVEPASLRDRNVSGEGRLRIGEDDSWIPFRFQALYDTRAARVSYPYLVLGGGDSAEPLTADSRIAQALDRRIDRALAREFAQQPVDMVLDRVTSAPAGERYLTVQASGTADFAGEGRTAARVRALYDRRSGQWLRLDYELGATANWAEPAHPAVAAR